MSIPSVLVTGAGGMLGSALVWAWQHRYRVTGATQTGKLLLERSWIGDLAGPGAARDVVQYARPDLVVHAAALTDVDACEMHPDQAIRVNAEATGRLAMAAKQADSVFVYISTDGVFDGERGDYRETDAPNPVNQYAASKLAGEHAALAANPESLVLRIGLEGWRPRGNPGFVQWVVEGLRRGERRTICTDWVHSVVFAPNLAEIIESLWKAKASGIFHVGAEAAASNWDIARATAAEFGLDSSLLAPITGDQLRLRAPRPRNVSLLSDRLRRTIGHSAWELHRGLTGMLLQETSGELTAIRKLVGA